MAQRLRCGRKILSAINLILCRCSNGHVAVYPNGAIKIVFDQYDHDFMIPTLIAFLARYRSMKKHSKPGVLKRGRLGHDKWSTAGARTDIYRLPCNFPTVVRISRSE